MDPKIKLSIGDITFLIGALITTFIVFYWIDEVSHRNGVELLYVVIAVIGIYLMGKSKLN